MAGFIVPTIQVRRNRMYFNLMDMYHVAGPDIQAYGRVWYENAHALAQVLADAYGIPLKVAAGTIAIISPQTEWILNLRNAVKLVRHSQLGTDLTGITSLPKMNGLALQMLANPHDDPALLINGPKTSNFYRNIVNPADPDAVTIDGHQFRLMSWEGGEPMSPNEAVRFIGRKAGYDVVADIVRDAARDLGVLPSVLQAVSWVKWRMILQPRQVTQYLPTFEEQRAMMLAV